MSRKLDKILVIDVESTCWSNGVPSGQHNEIIEIGICLIDTKSLSVSDKQSILVRPELSTVSKFCTDLTTLTQEQVDGGYSFHEACAKLETEYKSRDRLWLSWGQYDQRIFSNNCSLKGVRYPFSVNHVNAKSMFALLYGLHKEVGMAQALEMLDIPLEGQHHRGSDDSANIAKIIVWMMSQFRLPLNAL